MKRGRGEGGIARVKLENVRYKHGKHMRCVLGMCGAVHSERTGKNTTGPRKIANTQNFRITIFAALHVNI